MRRWIIVNTLDLGIGIPIPLFKGLNMIFSEFHYRLKKLNHRLWIDVNKETRIRDPNFPTAGLYLDDKFLMGVPHQEVPEYSIAGINFNEMILYGRYEELKKAQDTGFCSEEKILWRGWRAIVNSLILQGYVNKDKAEKLFNTHFDNRKEFPRTYINKDI